MDAFNCHIMFLPNMRLLKVSMQNEYGPEGYLHFCEQDVTWSFYSVGGLHRGSHDQLGQVLPLPLNLVILIGNAIKQTTRDNLQSIDVYPGQIVGGGVPLTIPYVSSFGWNNVKRKVAASQVEGYKLQQILKKFKT